jgi:hypothetical protein
MQQSLMKPAFWIGRNLAISYVLLITIVMAGTGLIALYEGTTRFMQPFVVENSGQAAREAVEKLRSAPDIDTLGDVSQELAFLARATSIERFANSRLPEQGIYYATMPKTNQLLMVTHVLLGVFCLVVGGFQFWPQFRKRFMKVHRAFGALYVITAPLSVVLALVYLVYTPPHHIYAHLVAWVALWIFGLLAIFSIVMAVRAIRARRIHEHQAWMALSFGCLIVAPMLRWNWLLLGLAFPEIDQETLNQVTLAIMVPEVLLISYGLTLANRQYRTAMLRRPANTLAIRCRQLFASAMPLWQGLAVVTIMVNAASWVFADGTLSLAPAGLIPGALPGQEVATFQNHAWLGSLLTISSAAALLIGLSLLNKLLADPDNKLRHLPTMTFVAASLLMAALCIFTGRDIGLAGNLQLFSGGTTYVLAGLLTGVFSLFFLATYLAGNAALMKESLIFVLATLPFNALLLLFLWMTHGLSLPADYLIVGQGYLLPAGASMSLFFIAMLYVVYGQATRQHG